MLCQMGEGFAGHQRLAQDLVGRRQVLHDYEGQLWIVVVQGWDVLGAVLGFLSQSAGFNACPLLQRQTCIPQALAK